MQVLANVDIRKLKRGHEELAQTMKLEKVDKVDISPPPPPWGRYAIIHAATEATRVTEQILRNERCKDFYFCVVDLSIRLKAKISHQSIGLLFKWSNFSKTGFIGTMMQLAQESVKEHFE